MPVGQVAVGLGDHLRVDLVEDGVLGLVGPPVGGLEPGGLDRGEPRPTTHGVDAQVVGDDGEPRVEAALTGERGQRPPGPGEGLLDDVLGLVRLVEALDAVTEQPTPVADVERVEGPAVPGLAALDQVAVALEVALPVVRRTVVGDQVVGVLPKCHVPPSFPGRPVLSITVAGSSLWVAHRPEVRWCRPCTHCTEWETELDGETCGRIRKFRKFARCPSSGRSRSDVLGERDRGTRPGCTDRSPQVGRGVDAREHRWPAPPSGRSGRWVLALTVTSCTGAQAHRPQGRSPR